MNTEVDGVFDDVFEDADDWLGRTMAADLLTLSGTQLADLVREGRKHLLYMAVVVGAVEGKEAQR